ncbi:MAG TPA: hypothetical protein VFN87_00115 [Solirubrobacteraceae bacterium]|nr:hypothetical protein [Solirubrobacteraceae bacterium]
MNRRDQSRLPRSPRVHSDTRVAQLAGAFLAGGWLLAMLELILLGRVTTPALGLAAIGGALLVVGFLAAILRAPQRFGDPEPGGEEDGDDDGGSGGEAPDPLPPTGGLEVDWERFEQDFRAYADAQTTVAEIVGA